MLRQEIVTIEFYKNNHLWMSSERERERETIDENKKCKWKWAVSGVKENTKLIQLHEKLIEHLIKKKYINTIYNARLLRQVKVNSR